MTTYDVLGLEKGPIDFHSWYGMYRKPDKWDDVGYPIPQEFLDALPTYRAEDLGIHNYIGATFKIQTPTIFLVKRGIGLYLVVTEGAEYARYVRYVGLAPVAPWTPGEDLSIGQDTKEHVLSALSNGGYNSIEKDIILSLIHISEPTRLLSISYAVF